MVFLFSIKTKLHVHEYQNAFYIPIIILLCKIYSEQQDFRLSVFLYFCNAYYHNVG